MSFADVVTFCIWLATMNLADEVERYLNLRILYEQRFIAMFGGIRFFKSRDMCDCFKLN